MSSSSRTFNVSRVELDNPGFEDDSPIPAGSRLHSIDLSDEKRRTSTQHSHLQDDGQMRRLSQSYATFQQSLRRMTREALPRLDHYRNLASIANFSGSTSQRPTLDDLLQPPLEKETLADETSPLEGFQGPEKFGWIKGVLVRCLLNIWGVILFLRLSWVTGQAGILGAILIVVCSNVVTSITALSMSAISTNGQVKGGGTYYLISRSLGPEFGGAIGLIFALANAIAAALHIVGFCESMLDLLATYELKILDGDINDVRVIATITLVALTAVCMIGMAWEARAQVFLLIVLVVSMLVYIIGAFVGPMDNEEIAKGFVGINGSVFMDNMYSNYRVDETGQPQSFFSVFSVFFPACTGILAGANISGDLKDPSAAIPKGTLLAIVITFGSYIIFIFLCGAAEVRDATGVITVANASQLVDWSFTNCNVSGGCKYGLQNSSQVMELMSIFGPLIYAGCFAASLSSALACLVSGPKVFQALCKDKLYPYIEFFIRGNRKNGEPFREFGLAFIISLIFALIGRLDLIAPIITNFFLAAYALINFSTFHASMQKVPGWRPTFKYYNKWLSLAGGILSTAIMFLIQWWTALMTVIIIILLYVVVSYRKPEVNWGSSTQAQTYSMALSTVKALSNVEEHIKTYRPQLLVFSGQPSARPPLMHFANAITKNTSLLVAGHCSTDPKIKKVHPQSVAESRKWLADQKIRGFYNFSDGPSMDLAARSMMTNVGLGKLRPNIVLLGYKANWNNCPTNELSNYFKIIQHAFDKHMAVGVLRVEGGMDYSNVVEASQLKEGRMISHNPSGSGGSQDPHSYQEAIHSHPPATSFEIADESSSGLAMKFWKKKKDKVYVTTKGEPVAPQVVDAMLRFTKKQPKGTIDVWWLFDDGGLTLLIPYILTTRAHWSHCPLRVFCLANKKDDLAAEQLKMTELLCRFRIDFSDVVMVPDVQKKPTKESLDEFESLIQKFKVSSEESNEGEGITDSDLVSLREKTNRHLRIREMLMQHSRRASLIVMTLPMPVVGSVPAPLYMAWLETLTKDMPPFLLLRGNQTSVLTFYS